MKKLITILIIAALCALCFVIPIRIETLSEINLDDAKVYSIQYSNNGKLDDISPRKGNIPNGFRDLKCKLRFTIPDAVRINTGTYTIFMTDGVNEAFFTFDEEGNMYKAVGPVAFKFKVSDEEFYKVLKKKF